MNNIERKDVSDIKRRLHITEKTLKELEGIEFSTSTPRKEALKQAERPPAPFDWSDSTRNSQSNPAQSDSTPSWPAGSLKPAYTDTRMYSIEQGYFSEPRQQQQQPQRDGQQRGGGKYERMPGYYNAMPQPEGAQQQQQQQQPYRQQQQQQQQIMYAEPPQPHARYPVESVPSSQHAGSRSSQQQMMQPDLSVASSSSLSLDTESLRRRLQQVREENAALVAHNHRLMNELERAGCELQGANSKVEEVCAEMASMVKKLTVMEEKLHDLEVESKSQHENIRDAEERFEESQREVAEYTAEVQRYRTQLEHLRAQMTDLTKHKTRAETERDKVLHSAEQIQESFELYQQRTQHSIDKLEQERTSLADQMSVAQQEREDLQARLTATDDVVQQLRAKMKKYKDDKSETSELVGDLEQHNQQLRTQINLQAEKIGQLDGELRSNQRIKKENRELKSIIEQQKAKLSMCHKQIQEIKVKAAANRTNTRGRVSDPGGGSKLHEDAAYSREQDMIQQAQIEQLRSEVSVKDAEISELRSFIESQRAASPTKALDTSKRELQAAIDAKRQAEGHCSELESGLQRLEDERARHMTRIMQLEEKLADLDLQNTSHDSRLSHRTAQVTTLQTEMADKTQEITQLERELRKKTGQLTSLEHELEDKVSQVTDSMARLGELEGQLDGRASEAATLRAELQDRAQQASQHQARMQEVTRLHAEQCQELHAQIERTQQRLSDAEGIQAAREKVIEDLRLQVLSKEAQHQQARQELSFSVTGSERNVGMLRDQLGELETALQQTRDQLTSALSQYTALTDSHNAEVDAKQQQIHDLEQRLSSARAASTEHEDRVERMQQTLTEGQKMLQAANQRVSQLEEEQQTLNKQIFERDQTMGRERAAREQEVVTLRQDMKALDSKLTKAVAELGKKSRYVKEAANKMKESEYLCEQFRVDQEDVRRQLQEERGLADTRMEQIQQIEGELRAQANKTKMLMEKGSDLEDSLSRAQEELQDKSMRAAEFYEQLTDTQRALQKTEAEVEETQHCLNDTQLQLQNKDKLLDDIKAKYRQSVDECRSREREVVELQQLLNDRQRDLQHRAAQLTQIDMAMKSRFSDLEQKNIQLESSLQKVSLDLQHRNKQVSDLNHKLSEAHDDMKRSHMALTEAEQHIQTLAAHTDKANDGTAQIEKQMESARLALEEAREENIELNKQLRLNRECHQKLEFDLSECKREMAALQRDHDRTVQEHTQAHTVIKSAFEAKESELSRVSAALATTQQQESSAGMYQKQIQDLHKQHEHKMSEMKNLQRELVLEKQHECEELSVHEASVRKELDTACHHIAQLEGQLMAHKQMLDTANQSLVIKESEVARLEGRMAGFHRAHLELQASRVSSSRSGDSSTLPYQSRSGGGSSNTAAYQSHPPPPLNLSALSDTYASHKSNSDKPISSPNLPFQTEPTAPPPRSTEKYQGQGYRNQGQSDAGQVQGRMSPTHNCQGQRSPSGARSPSRARSPVQSQGHRLSFQGHGSPQSPHRPTCDMSEYHPSSPRSSYSPRRTTDTSFSTKSSPRQRLDLTAQQIRESTLNQVLDLSDSNATIESLVVVAHEKSMVPLPPSLNLRPVEYQEEDTHSERSSRLTTLSPSPSELAEDLSRDPDSFQAMLREVRKKDSSKLASYDNPTASSRAKSIDPKKKVFTSSPVSKKSGAKHNFSSNNGSRKASRSHSGTRVGSKRSSYGSKSGAPRNISGNNNVAAQEKNNKKSPQFRSKSPNISTAMGHYVDTSGAQNFSYQSEDMSSVSEASHVTKGSQSQSMKTGASVEDLLLVGKRKGGNDKVKMSRSSSIPDILNAGSKKQHAAVGGGSRSNVLTPQQCLVQLQEKTAALQQKQQELDRQIYSTHWGGQHGEDEEEEDSDEP